MRGARPDERPHGGVGAHGVDGVEDELDACIEPVDGRVDIVGRLAVAYLPGIQRLVAPVGDDLRRPSVSAADVAEQLPDRPIRTCRNGGGRIGGANQFAERPGLLDERSTEIHVTNLAQ